MSRYSLIHIQDTKRSSTLREKKLPQADSVNFSSQQTVSQDILMLLKESGSQILELSVYPHRPLGCTVEESLVTSSINTFDTTSGLAQSLNKNYLFVSKVVEGGNADKAGIQTGDVIVGLSGIFDGEIRDVTHDGVNKIKSLVACRPENEPLVVRLIRGSSVLARHEEALVELCSNPGSIDEAEQCLLDFMKNSYDVSFPSSLDEEMEDCILNDDEAECLIDGLCNIWAEELPQKLPTLQPLNTKEFQTPSRIKPKVKPWSSRSSPSGTWVRDPVTGKMNNLDA